LLFLVPVPGSVLDEVLLPLKQWVSQFVTWLLYCAGYPIARNGVVLTIGNYELLIADACSGLNSMLALSGIGLLYVYLAGHQSRWWNAVLLISVLPIAFAANILRVLSLVLITYYAGDRPGRWFHDKAGYLEILAAFACFFGFDHLLRALWKPSASTARAA
jgi:exosortase